jgi:type I restriction enzyme S subunit
MKKNKNIPEIRFKGFEGEWTNSQMSVLADYSKGRGYTKNDLIKNGTPIILYGRLYTKYGTSISEVDTFVVDKKGSVYSKGSEVIVPASGETAEDIAIASVVEMPGIILGGDLNIIRLNNKIHPLFLALSISHGQQHNELSKKAQGKSIVHLQNSDIKETTLIYPQRKEQSRIGSFFKKLDKLITLEQQKYDKLQILKKAMLEKMFPKDGADVPEIRFKGFSEVWKITKLKYISDIIGGGTPSTNIKEYWNGDIDWYSPTEIGYNVYAEGSVNKITSLGLEKSSAKILPKNRTVLFTSRAGIGDMAILKIDGATNQGFQSIVLKKGIDTYFIYSSGHLIKQYALKYASGSTFLEISGKQLGEMKLLLPTEKEQKKIGSYFQNLDSLISLQQQKIEKLKNIKKACLEKMFV